MVYGLTCALDRIEITVLLGWALVSASVLAGLYYCVLGTRALKHLLDATEQDRFIGWALWWFLETARYNEEGRRLCRLGGAVFAIVWSLAIPGYYFVLRS